MDKAASFDFIEYDSTGTYKLSFRIVRFELSAALMNALSQTSRLMSSRRNGIWAKLTAYNITETLVSHTVVSQKKTEHEYKHEYKVNFSVAAHICRVFLRPKKDLMDVMSLLQK